MDSDLTIRPFGWKGHQATLRGMAEESLHIHQGLLSNRIQLAVGDGSLDAGPYGKGPWYDVDEDGVSPEINSRHADDRGGLPGAARGADHAPATRPGLLDAWAAGRSRFDDIGCAACHIPTLELTDTKLEAREDPDPTRPTFVIDVAKDGDGPKIEPKYGGSVTPYLVHLFSDLKRHDMGEALATPAPQGAIPARVFLTRPLWGLAETAPYLHDGRAPTVHDAIVMHGGEATAARDAYLALDEPGRASIRVFLDVARRASRSCSCHETACGETPGVPGGALPAPRRMQTRDERARLVARRLPAARQAEPLSLEAARDAQRAAARRHELRLREAATPGSFLREMRAALDPARVAAGEVCLDELADRGQLLFEHEYGFADGLASGAAARKQAGPFRRVHDGVFGGPETISCPSCHWIGGPNGAGAETDTAFLSGDGVRTASGDERNPPALVGLGVVQALAREMSRDLQRQRDDLARDAARAGAAREARLVAKGVDFGSLRVTPAGEVDTSGVNGVDADLVVKPFGWKGTLATFTDFAAEALQVHLGIQSDMLLESNVLLAVGARSLLGGRRRSSRPRRRRRARRAGPRTLRGDDGAPGAARDSRGRAADPEPPARPGRAGRSLPPTTTSFAQDFQRGRRQFHELGCAGCHVPALVLESPILEVEGLPPIDLARDMRQPGLRQGPTPRRLSGLAVQRSEAPRHGESQCRPACATRSARPSSISRRASGGSPIRRPTCTTAAPRASTTRSPVTTARAPRRAPPSRRCRWQTAARSASI